MRRRVPSPAARSTACRDSKSRGAGRIVGKFPTLSHKHIRISLCQSRGGCKAVQPFAGESLEIGGWPSAVEYRDAACPVAEFYNEINEIVRAGLHIACSVRLHRDDRPACLGPDDRAGVLAPIPAA